MYLIFNCLLACSFIFGQEPVITLIHSIKRATIEIARRRLRRVSIFERVLVGSHLVGRRLACSLGLVDFPFRVWANLHEGWWWRLVKCRRLIFNLGHGWIHAFRFCFKVQGTDLAISSAVSEWAGWNMLLLVFWWTEHHMVRLCLLELGNKLLNQVVSLLNKLLIRHVKLVLVE